MEALLTEDHNQDGAVPRKDNNIQETKNMEIQTEAALRGRSVAEHWCY